MLPPHLNTSHWTLLSFYFKIVRDWEKSGNGFGQRVHTEEEWGHFHGCYNMQDGDNRGSFLPNDVSNREHLLYFWDLSEEEGVLGNMLNILAKDVAVDCHGNLTVDTSRVQHKRKRTIQDEAEQSERKAFRDSLGSSMKSIAMTQLKENLRVTLEMAAKYEVKALTEDNLSIKAVYERMKREQESMANDIRAEIAAFTRIRKEEDDEE